MRKAPPLPLRKVLQTTADRRQTADTGTRTTMPEDEKTPLANANKEKEDLKEPLPADWKKENLNDAVVYNMKVSPPCCKIRAIFHHYGIKFTVVEGAKKDSEYKKVPVVVINGRQINDSHIIVKNLASILDGKPLSQEELKVEETFTFGAMIALEAEVSLRSSQSSHVFKSPISVNALLSHSRSPCFRLQQIAVIYAPAQSLLEALIFSVNCCLLSFFSCCICCCIPQGFYKRNPGLKSVAEYREEFATMLGDKPFFHGSKAGIVDVGLYGGMLPFHVTDTNAMAVMLSNDKISAWWKRMDESSPAKNKLFS
eukprot:jgi/Bigna1/90335/estExt_fgenesh1_pg.C_670092